MMGAQPPSPDQDHEVQIVERQIALRELDNAWSDHLEQVAEIREGIHLVSMGGLNPIDEFNREVVKRFRSFFDHVDAQTILAIKDHFENQVRTGAQGPNINGSSATWTYMINDNPMGDLVERIRRRARQIWKQGF
jgi:preprotein translocase subunit SecA